MNKFLLFSTKIPSVLLHFDLSMHDISNAIKTFISFTLFLSVKHGAIQTCSSAVSNSTSMLKLNHFLSYRFRYTMAQACNRGIENWNVAKGSLKGLKIIFLDKAKIVYYFFISRQKLYSSNTLSLERFKKC